MIYSAIAHLTDLLVKKAAVFACIVLLASLGFTSGSFAANKSYNGPWMQLENTTNHIIEVLRDPAISKEERQKLLQAAIEERIDFREMSKRTLGRHWKKYANREGEFGSLFRSLLESAYLSKIGGIKDAKIQFKGETIDGTVATVEVDALTSEGNKIPLQFRLHLVGDQWKVFDFVIEGVSMVANYRSQFNKIITETSFDELLRRLQKKLEENHKDKKSR